VVGHEAFEPPAELLAQLHRRGTQEVWDVVALLLGEVLGIGLTSVLDPCPPFVTAGLGRRIATAGLGRRTSLPASAAAARRMASRISSWSLIASFVSSSLSSTFCSRAG
jgi:hypothetical protein